MHFQLLESDFNPGWWIVTIQQQSWVKLPVNVLKVLHNTFPLVSAEGEWGGVEGNKTKQSAE